MRKFSYFLSVALLLLSAPQAFAIGTYSIVRGQQPTIAWSVGGGTTSCSPSTSYTTNDSDGVRSTWATAGTTAIGSKDLPSVTTNSASPYTFKCTANSVSDTATLNVYSEPTETATCSYNSSNSTYSITVNWSAANAATDPTNYPQRLSGPSHATGAGGFTIQNINGSDVVSTGGANNAPTGTSMTWTGLTAAGTYTYWGHVWSQTNGWSVNPSTTGAPNSAMYGTVTCTAPAPTNNATCSSLTAPSSVLAGQSFSGTIVMQNSGNTTWTSASNYNLGSQSLQDNTTWGTNRISLPASTSAGSSASFTRTFTAPSTPGTYAFAWKMVQDGVEWFGATCSQNITVNAGSCGTANNHTYADTDTGWGAYTFCASGTPSPASPTFPNQGGSTNWTCSGSATCTAYRSAPAGSPPATPTGFVASASTCGNNWLNLSWNTSTGATGYTVKEGTRTVYSGAGTSVSDTGLTLGSSHTYTIYASNAYGNSATTQTTGTVANACPANCPTQTVNWGSCSGSLTGVASGNSSTANNTVTGFSGTATYSCSNGTWSQTSQSCSAVTSSQPDLTPSTASPTTATAGSATTLSATINNQGTASTGASFSNFFQVATAAGGGGTVTDLAATTMTTLAAGASNTASQSYTFPSSGTYSIRVCADKTSSAGGGVITESDENNNCSATWTTVTVASAPLASCGAQGVNWGAGNICSAVLPSNTASGNQATVTNTNNTFTYSGSATYSCSNGTWSGPSTSSCTCNDSAASNYGGAAPCTYSAICSGTQDISTTGTTAGNVWGTDIYTDDSTLGAAAVHAGILGVGQTATIRETFQSSPSGYTGSLRNGVQSMGWGVHDCAMTLTNLTPAAPTGTITAPNCTILSGNSSCSTTVNWTNSNTPSGVSVRQDGTQFSTASNSSRTRTVGNTASTFTLINVSDGSTLDSDTARGVCEYTATTKTGWNGTDCQEGYLPDLTADPASPSSAQKNVSTTLQATVRNIGPVTTGASFRVFFQVATASQGGGTVSDLTNSTLSALASNASVVTSKAYTFPADGVYSIRVCADKRNSSDNGQIDEADESNNCGNWTDVQVGATTGTLTMPASCIIPAGNSTCPVAVSWTTQNATTSVTVQRAYSPFGTIPGGTGNSGSTNVTFAPPGSYTLNLMHGSTILDSDTVVVDCASNSNWNGSSNVCEIPLPSITVTDPGPSCNHTSPCALQFFCTNATTYSISRDGTALVTNAAYTSAVNYPITILGNYTMTCTNSRGNDSKVLYYDPNPLMPQNIVLNGSPRTIEAGGKVTLSWSITNPISSCKIIVTPVCTGTCGANQISAAQSLQTTLNSGTTDSNDPYGASRSMANALQTVSPADPSGTKALGKKTLQLNYTSDFLMGCGTATAASSSVRVITSKNNEG